MTILLGKYYDIIALASVAQICAEKDANCVIVLSLLRRGYGAFPLRAGVRLSIRSNSRYL